MMGPLRSIVVSVGILLLATGQAAAQGVLLDKSEIRFMAKQMGVNVEGRFRKWKADVVFLPNALQNSKAELEIDLASIDLASEDSEAELKGAPWFDTAKFPVARFTSTSIKDLGGDKFEVAGRLSLKGISRDCLVPIAIRKDAVGNRVAEGTFALKRLDYKIGEGLWADTNTVADNVSVRIRMVLPPAT